MPQPTDRERKILMAIAERRACDHIAAARLVGISSDYADQLCRYLLKWGYVQQSGRVYTLSKTGQAVVAKELEKEAARGKKETKEPVVAGSGIVWDRWCGGFSVAREREGVFPQEGMVWETYRPVGMGRGAIAKEPSLPELLWEEKYQCAFCGGEGYSPPGTKCPVCKGSGSVTFFEPPVVKCGYCRGTGRKEKRVHITCIVCRGKGFVPVKEPIEICQVCQGRGLSSDKLPCTTCNGKGMVTVRERVAS
ncbi:MAG: hypothetical protein QMC90_03410 [Dehalococcoidales bacterium]|nr:hypothetical protein [Dehalococcoidales bacterium]